MNLSAYRSEHPHCELGRYFADLREVVVPLSPVVRLSGRNGIIPAHEIHHIIGQTSRGRTNDERNILHVNHYVHAWLERYKLAGRVLCCRELQRQGRLDWGFLGELHGRCYPGCFDSDAYRESCGLFPFVERYRVQLLAA